MRHRQPALTSYGFFVAALFHMFMVHVGHAVRPESPDSTSGDLSAFGDKLEILISKVSNTISSGLNMSYHIASEEDRHYKELRDRLRHGLQGFAHGARHLQSRIPKEQSKWIADIQTVITNATVHHGANNGNSLGALKSRNALPHAQIASAGGRLAEKTRLRDPLEKEKLFKMRKASSYATAFKNPIDADNSNSWLSPVDIDAAEALEIQAVDSWSF